MNVCSLQPTFLLLFYWNNYGVVSSQVNSFPPNSLPPFKTSVKRKLLKLVSTFHWEPCTQGYQGTETLHWIYLKDTAAIDGCLFWWCFLQGRCPFYIEPAIIISFSDGESMVTANGVHKQVCWFGVQFIKLLFVCKKIM